MIEPGYECLAIWRSTGRTASADAIARCATTAVLKCNCASIRGGRFAAKSASCAQAGGYTFRLPGEYRIQIELERPARRVQSNVKTLTAKTVERSSLPLMPLARPAVARILYPSDDRSRSRTLQGLVDFAAKHRRLPATGAVQYAIGRSLGHRRAECHVREGAACAPEGQQATLMVSL